MERKTLKHKVFSIEEKNQIILLYLDRHMGPSEIFRKYNISNKSVFWRWMKQYQEFGTCVDRRGQGTQNEYPTKGRPKKYVEDLESLTKSQLIEKVRLYEDIKKSLAYLMSHPSNKNIKS